MRRSPFQLVPGQALDRYQVLFPVDSDASARVWVARLAHPQALETLVAVRAPSNSRSPAVDCERALRLEARLASRIRHPNVVQYLDVVKHEGASYLITEWIHGRTLADLARSASDDGALPVRVAVQIALQACKGLGAVHELCAPDGRGLAWVHGDVSPRRLHVDTSGQVKLLDLGIASGPSHRRSERGGGSGAFVAPEVARGQRVDARADVFSLGAILYLLTTGRSPFGPTAAAAVEPCPPALPPSAIVRGYPKQLERVVVRALARRRERRFQSTSELHAALAAAFPAPASKTELAEFLRSSCGESLAREQWQIEQSTRRRPAEPLHGRDGEALELELPGVAALGSDTLSPSSRPATAEYELGIVRRRSATIPVATAAVAFAAAFALTVGFSWPERRPAAKVAAPTPARDARYARTALSPQPATTTPAAPIATASLSAASARTESMSEPSGAAASARRASVATAKSAAPKAPRRPPRTDGNAAVVLRRYGI
jgi:serine/threonine-protein kinase